MSSTANYHFRAPEYSGSRDTINTHIAWAYDAFGRKISETVYDDTGAVTARKNFVYDGWQVLEERDGTTNNVLAEYVHGPDYIDDVIQSKHGGQTYYHHTDAQYSTVALTDAEGNVAERYNYDPYGSPSFYAGDGTPRTSSAIGNATLFTGRTWDPRINLYDYRTRMYSPTIGRFTTPDPLGPWGDAVNMGNAYTYVGNNPLAGVDPFGLWAWDADYVQYGLGGLLGFQGASTAGETWRGVAKFTGEDYENMEGLVSFAPVVGIPADIDLARKDFQRGNYVMGTIGVIGIIPILGDAVSAVAKGTEAIVDAARAGEVIADVAKGAESTGKAGKQVEGAVAEVAKRGWKVGEPITNPTAKGNVPKWSTVRERYWKNRAQTASPEEFGAENVERMRKGRAHGGSTHCAGAVAFFHDL